MSEAFLSRLDRLLDRLGAGLPRPQTWFFALRIWTAMMLELYVAFGLQLESASSAAVSVAILAQPKRGQAIAKAIYRFLGTILGGGVSIVFAAAFGQDRVLMLVCFTTWLSLCVFVAQSSGGGARRERPCRGREGHGAAPALPEQGSDPRGLTAERPLAASQTRRRRARSRSAGTRLKIVAHRIKSARHHASASSRAGRFPITVTHR